jgi:hypothetical protein
MCVRDACASPPLRVVRVKAARLVPVYRGFSERRWLRASRLEALRAEAHRSGTEDAESGQSLAAQAQDI